jgi:hypothetical protein
VGRLCCISPGRGKLERCMGVADNVGANIYLMNLFTLLELTKETSLT